MALASRRYSAKEAAKIISEMNESDILDIESSEESSNIESDEDDELVYKVCEACR